jgi:hypothetical protein
VCASGSNVIAGGGAGGGSGEAQLVRGASITLDMTMDQVGIPDTAFRVSFRQDVATLIQVSTDRVNVVGIAPGSVVVEFEVFALSPGAQGESSDVALERLAQAFQQPQKPTIAGFPTLHYAIQTAAVTAEDSTPGQAACAGSLTLDTNLEAHETNRQLYRRVTINRDTPDAYGRAGESVLEVTCAGCQCPDYEVPEIEITSENFGKCTDGSAPDRSITSCCEDGDTACTGPKCSDCCTPCRYGRLNTRLDEWPDSPTVRTGDTALGAGHTPVCMYQEPEFCPAFGMVLECVPPGSEVAVIPGQPGYEECISGGFSGQQATFFGMNNFPAKEGCPLSIRSAFALEGEGELVYGGVGKGFGVERACSNGDPDWLTTATTCSDECAKAFFQLWASCGSEIGSIGIPPTREMFWRYDESGATDEDRVVTVTIQALLDFYELCTPADGSCPAGTARGQTIGSGDLEDTEIISDYCLPPNWGFMGCPFACTRGSVVSTTDPLMGAICQPCPRGSYECGNGCTPCPAGFDAHAGSEACMACPFPDRCRGWNGTNVANAEDFLGCDGEAGVRQMAFCSSCEFGRFPFRDKCLPCPAFSWTSIAVVVLAAVGFPVLLWKLSAVDDVEGRQSQYGHIALMVSVILPHVQFSTWLMGISLKWPDFVTGIAKWIGDLVFLDFGSLSTLDCLTQSSAKRKIADFAPASMLEDNANTQYDVHLDVDEPGDMEFLKFVLQTVVFFVIVVFFLGDFFTGGCCSKDRKNHAANAVGTTFCLMYPVLIKTSFTMLDCTMEQPCALDLDECTYYLDVAPATECYTVPMNGARWAFWDLRGENKFYMLWAGFVSFIYIVVIPGIFFTLLYRAHLSDGKHRLINPPPC